MPMDRSRYPADWAAISRRIREERARGICECRGECGKHRGVCPERNGERAIHFRGRVVLTVAHLNHRPEDCRDENLRAMCQRCHLAYDEEEHRANGRKRPRADDGHQGELPL